eukprot:CAMPEP_0179065874 /NCGR_PEP_ID=MMETSP0796-20121207/28686_1 /TAXON_ID=73915 /ORGANISM="Pyrodinium bahamense, Strain pbaha01" /LENGTH=63 /DNA_ID=CAMNT_0020762861 /DNA_START=775 /DNA_END=962 /DNA_ORIENTATION=+
MRNLDVSMASWAATAPVAGMPHRAAPMGGRGPTAEQPPEAHQPCGLQAYMLGWRQTAGLGGTS